MNRLFSGRARLTLALVILLASVLRLAKLDKYGIWQDEQWSVTTSVGLNYIMFDTANFFNQWAEPWQKELWSRDTIWKNKEAFTSQDFWKQNTLPNVTRATVFASNNPAYSISLHYWIRVFGVSDFAVRSYSVLWGILAVILAYAFTQFLFRSEKISLFVTLLFSIHPWLILESQSAKAHSMALFFSFLSTYLFLRLIYSHKNRILLPAYILSCIIALMTHMLMVYVLFGHALVMIFVLRDKRLFLRLLTAGIAVGLVYSVWLFSVAFESLKFLGAFTAFIKNNVNNPEWTGKLFFIPFSPVSYLREIEKVILALWGNLILTSAGSWLRFFILPVLVPIFIIVVSYFRKKDIQYKKELLIMLGLVVVFFLFATVMSIKDNQMLHFRPVNAIHAMPYAIIFFGIICYQLANAKSWLGILTKLMVVLQILTMAYSTWRIYTDPKDEAYDFVRYNNYYKAAAEAVILAYKPKDTVVFRDWRTAQCTNLYLRDFPEILQKVDTIKTTGNKLIVTTYSSGAKREVFDFEDKN